LSPEKIAEKAEVYFCFSNHAKIVMTNNIAYIGSSNFSEESADNFESGFISKDADFIEFLEEEIFPWIIESSSEYKTDEENTKDLDFERKHKEDLQRIRGFRLLDDDFMSKVFEDKDCTEFLLQIILNRTDLKVLRVHGQYDIRNLQGRSVRLDILAVDTEERVYNIEIQRSDKGAVVKRARYNSSLIDVNITEPGEKYENLCESYIIFITENDIMKAGLPIYHVDRIVKETGELFGDESHIIYVNSQIKDESALGKLMHDFSCTDAKDMNYKILADRVRYFKEDEKGVATMCRVMEEMRNETAHEKAVQIAKRMLKSGKLSYEEIAEFAELTVEEVKALDEKVIA
jgi:predicted transposase/invertase (TIGR01784 family)